MESPQVYYYKNDTLLELTGLKDEATDAYIATATVTASVKDAAGAAVTGQTWPLSLVYVTSSDGDYRGVLDKAINVAVGDRITVEVTVDAGSGRDAFFAIPVTVRQRGKVYY